MERSEIAFRLALLQDRTTTHAPDGKASYQEAKEDTANHQIRSSSAQMIG